MMAKILFSDNEETEQKQIARIKKEIEFLTEDLQLREEKIEKVRNKK
jgi:hypothetical protein